MNIYNKENIFYKILKKEIPCDIVNENRNALAFNDISPRAPIHILVIPKNNYVNFHHFIEEASNKEVTDFFSLIDQIIKEKKLDKKGYRLISNTGEYGNQEVKHLHFHLLSGKNLGIMLN